MKSPRKRAAESWLANIVDRCVAAYEGRTASIALMGEIGSAVHREIEVNRDWIEELLGETLRSVAYLVSVLSPEEQHVKLVLLNGSVMKENEDYHLDSKGKVIAWWQPMERDVLQVLEVVGVSKDPDEEIRFGSKDG